MINYDKIPVPYMKTSVELWVEQGIRPGSFLEAVLANDFAMSAVKADRLNAKYLREWALFCLNELPDACWGSREKMKIWEEFKNV